MVFAYQKGVSMSLLIVNIKKELDDIEQFWKPTDIAQFNQLTVKLAKLKGEYEWHNHEYEDKLFHVLSGQLFIILEDKTVEVNAGEVVVIPKNSNHKPYAPTETSVMCFEPL